MCLFIKLGIILLINRNNTILINSLWFKMTVFRRKFDKNAMLEGLLLSVLLYFIILPVITNYCLITEGNQLL